MKSQIVLTLALFVGLPSWVSAQPASQQDPIMQLSRTAQSQMEQSSDERLARDWGLGTDEWARYEELMDGPLGIYSPNLDPLSALGVEARSDEERRRYAELQVQAEARRVEKLLAYQRAYDDAWQRMHSGLQRVNLPDATPGGMSIAGSGRTAIFVKDECASCGLLVQRLQTAGTEFDLYMVGSRQDDARIRELAKRMQIDPARVYSGTITLNHDGGRWLSLGLPGELPAVVRQVNGQWQRQP
ncbi:TIGR03759 family integrating conjugative element protein [Allopusillimonas ginsengisoli]|uniref:TIGR03759 family integrating conjugative element protein n=1 Tax=Allopusillimonas ginsengisoli TaxID=453575 RepID=UPI0039C4620B